MSFARALLWLTGAGFVVYGVAFVAAPEAMSQFVTGGSPASSSGVIDIRATYGGMSVGLGILFALAAGRSRFHGLGLRGVAAVMAGMAAARLLGIVVDGGANAMMWAYLGVEVVVLVLALVALRGAGGVD